MRVLHFYRTAFPDTMGGIEQAIHQIARGASKLGVETDVLSLSSEQVPTTVCSDGYQTHRAKLDWQVASTGISASVFSRFSELAEKADVINYHFPWPFMDVVHFAVKAKKPTVVTYHSDIIRQKFLLHLYRPLMKKFLSSVDCIVATSPNYIASSHVLRQYESKVSVIPLGLDNETYPEPVLDRLQYWNRRLGQKFFLFIGVLRYYKGLHILLEAARGTDLPIVIVGSGPIEQELKTQASRLGLNNILFLGRLPDEDKVCLLTLCYCVVSASHLRSEAFGISLLEGAMYGKPMISCEIGTGTTFINRENQTGLVVPPNDPDELRKSMQYLWNNPDHASKMGQHASEWYWERFTADQMAESYVRLYRELKGKRDGTYAGLH